MTLNEFFIENALPHWAKCDVLCPLLCICYGDLVVHIISVAVWMRRVYLLCFDFITARRYASVVLAVIVCLSVCLSVCLAQVRVVQRWLNLGSDQQRRTIAQRF